MNSRTSSKQAFTLTELLVVIAIIGILAAILIPILGRTRENARDAQCLSNVRQMASAVLVYASENKNTLPQVSETWPPHSSYRNTWLYKVWPYAGYAQEVIDRDISVISARQSLQRNIFICPSVQEKRYETPMFGTQTVNWNLYCYGLSNLSSSVDGNTWTKAVRLAEVESPARVTMINEGCFVAGTVSAYRSSYGMLPHSQAANFAFFDGHVERRAKADIPDLTNAAGRIFWTGRE